MTLGEQGALLSKNNAQEQKLFATKKVDVVDTTAALAVTVEGAEDSAPTLEKLNTYLEQKI
ncbi:hypothetical protein [Francisella sp. TX07-6608]|uniref:hypothetical protein n=1 Tax=Francisella sp. TX07-6608 TaxID=573568 RepID=UPI001F44AB1C|nr:hypothetical protein [Francisella sp. TX07-6608]